jgi:hypothetical protein
MKVITAVKDWLNRAVPQDPPFAKTDTVSEPGVIRQAAEAPSLVDISTSSVWMFLVFTDRATALLYRTPGSEPRLDLIDSEGERRDCGPVIAPGRFGSTGATKAEFAEWCQRFADSLVMEEW